MTKLSCFVLCNLWKSICVNLSGSIIQSPPFHIRTNNPICMHDIILKKKKVKKKKRVKFTLVIPSVSNEFCQCCCWRWTRTKIQVTLSTRHSVPGGPGKADWLLGAERWQHCQNECSLSPRGIYVYVGRVIPLLPELLTLQVGLSMITMEMKGCTLLLCAVNDASQLLPQEHIAVK